MYLSPNRVRGFKYRISGWVGHVARQEGRDALKNLMSQSTGKDLWGDRGVDGRTILEWTLKREVSMRVIGLIRLRIGIVGEPL